MVNHFQVTSQEFFYCKMDDLACNYTMYFPMLFNEYFELNRFIDSLNLILKSIPHLCCSAKENFFRGRWKGFSSFRIENIVENIRLEENTIKDQDEFYNLAFQKFLLWNRNKIHIFKEPPIKIKVIQSSEFKCTFLAFGIHHSIADGRGSMQLINLVSQAYTATAGGTEIKISKNYRSIPARFLKNSFSEMVNKTKNNMKKQFPKELLDPLVPKEGIVFTKDDLDSTEVITLERDTLDQLKEKYSAYAYSKNDIIIHLVMKIQYELSRKSDNLSKYLAVGIAVDSRDNIKKDIVTVTNYASMSAFLIEKEWIDDLETIKRKLEEFKEESKGASFAMEFVLLNFFPFALQKKIYQRFIVDTIADMSTKSIQTTNVGELSRHVSDFNGTLEQISFMGPAGRYGLPILSMSLYKEKLTIYIRKADDKTHVSRWISDLLREAINDILRKESISSKGKEKICQLLN